MQRARVIGVDHIITDDPKLLREVLRARAELDDTQKALLQLTDIARGWL